MKRKHHFSNPEFQSAETLQRYNAQCLCGLIRSAILSEAIPKCSQASGKKLIMIPVSWYPSLHPSIYFLSLFDFESKTRINVNEMQTWPISSSFILLGFVTKVVSPCQTMLFLLSLDKCIKHRSGWTLLCLHQSRTGHRQLAHWKHYGWTRV